MTCKPNETKLHYQQTMSSTGEVQHRRTLGSIGFAWLAMLLFVSACQSPPDMTGTYTLDKEVSTDVDTWQGIDLRITVSENEVAIGRLFNPRRFTRHDSISVPLDDTPVEVAMTGSAKWLDQPHLGVFIEDGSKQQIRARWEDPGRVLEVKQTQILQTSQGEATVDIVRSYALSDDGSTLTVTETRSSRPNTLTYVYRRNES